MTISSLTSSNIDQPEVDKERIFQMASSFRSFAQSTLNPKLFQEEGQELVPLNFSEYLQVCHQLLRVDALENNTLLPEKLFNDKITFWSHNSKLQRVLPEGSRCYWIVIPFTNGGRILSNEQIKNGEYLHWLPVDEDNMTVGGSFTANRSPIIQLFPEKIQKEPFFIVPPI